MNLLSKFIASSYGLKRSLMICVLVLGLGLSGCGRKSQVLEDVDTLKLVGYDLSQEGLFKAAINDDVQALKIFKGRDYDLSQVNLKGRSVVHVVAESGGMGALRYLSQQGLELDCADYAGVTPLMLAASAGKLENAEVIKFLLRKGADARRKDKIKKFPLIYALIGGSEEAIHLLAAQSRKLLDTGLLYAADMNHHEAIPILTRYGASVYARSNGMTSLMIAAQRGHEMAAKALIDEGANVYAVSDEGMLAKDYAGEDERLLAVLSGVDADKADAALDLEWSEFELENLVQKAMERSQVAEELSVTSEDVVKPVSDISQRPAANVGKIERRVAKIHRLQGKNLNVELQDSVTMSEQVTMAAYTERTIPIKVEAKSARKVEVIDLRQKQTEAMKREAVSEGSVIGVTGLSVRKIKQKIVNNKLTGGQDKELVTLLVEDLKTGNLREMYAGYDAQVADAVAVLKFKATNELMVVERDDTFYDSKGTAFRVMDVNDQEVIIENVSSGEQTMLPLLGIKR